MVVSGCGWPSYDNVSLMMSPYLKSMESAPNSTSSADDTTHVKIVQRVKIVPLSVMGSPSLVNEPRNKWPDAQLLEFFSYS